jgi:hypothetical protein
MRHGGCRRGGCRAIIVVIVVSNSHDGGKISAAAPPRTTNAKRRTTAAAEAGRCAEGVALQGPAKEIRLHHRRSVHTCNNNAIAAD